MANINIGVNFSGGTPPGPSGPGGGTPQGGGAGGKPKPGGGNAPGNDPGKAAAEAAAREAAARRALTQRMGKTFTDAQIAQVARDFAEMSRSSQRLKRFGGDMEKWMNGFSQTFPSQRQSNRHYHEVMQQLGIGQQQSGAGIGGMISQAVRGMFRATGAGGGVAGGIMHQSYNNARDSDGGMGSAGGMGMLGKGAGIAALAYVGIKAVQKIGQKVGDAQDEAVQYHDLRQSVGAVSVDFETLRDSVRHFTSGLGVTSAESAKLARSYAMSSQVFGKAAETGIGASVGRGVEMSRSYGLSPEVGVDFLATMRHFKASDGSEKGDQKLAYMIGEAVGKTGAFSKADEVMTAIAQFTETSTRQSLNSANVAGYADMMGVLGGLKLPGMDAKGTVSLVSQVQGNWASGGGIAGQNMRLGWMQQGFGANATDMGRVGDAGPMGSAESTFGENSAAYKLAKGRGDVGEMGRLLAMAKKGGDSTFFDREMTAMKGAIKDPAFLRMNIQAKYGTSDAGADSLITTHGKEGGMTGLMERVNAAVKAGGKDPAKINKQSIARLSMIDNADSSELENMREKALKYSGDNALSKTEKDSLTGAKGDDLKVVLTQIEAMRASEDEGKTAREAQVNLDRKFQEFAAKIIPLTNMIQEGIFKMLDSFGGLSEEMKQFQADKKYQEKLDKAGTEEEKAAITKQEMEKARPGKMTDEEFERRSKAIKSAHALDFDAAGPELEALKAEREKRNRLRPTAIKKALAEQSMSITAAHDAVMNGGTGNPVGEPNIRPNIRPDIAPGKKGAESTKVAPREPTNGSGLSDKEKSYLAETDRLLGAAPGTSEAQIMVESKGDHNAVSPMGAKGLGQIMPKEQSVMEGRMGRKITTREDQLEAHRLMMLENLKKFKSNEKAQKAYNGGWDEAKWKNKETSEYTEKIAAYRDKSIPDAARPYAGGQNAKVDVNVNGVMVGPDGRNYPLEASATGQFQQTSAGQRSRG